jgi:hypothetical protein
MFLTTLISVVALCFTGWQAVEARKARVDADAASASAANAATRANEIAARQASAAEYSNVLMQRTQEPFIVVRIQQTSTDSQLVLHNLKDSVAYDIYVGYKLRVIPIFDIDNPGWRQPLTADVRSVDLKLVTRALEGRGSMMLVSSVPRLTRRWSVINPGKPLLPDNLTFIDAPDLILGMVWWQDDARHLFKTPFCYVVHMKDVVDSDCDQINFSVFNDETLNSNPH